MNKYQKFTRARIIKFVNNLKDKYYESVSELKITVYKSKEPLQYLQRMNGEEMEIAIGDKWGDLFDCGWFHFQGIVPQNLAGKKVVLLIDISGEGCIVDSSGEPIQGITTGASAYKYETAKKRMVPVCEQAQGGEIIDIWMDAGMNDLFGSYAGDGKVAEAYIAVAYDKLRKMYYDFEVLLSALLNIDDNSPRYYTILHTLNSAINEYTDGSEDNIEKVCNILVPELEKKNGDVSFKISAIGHGHIDLAWLWPIRETIRKGARTFSTALALMDRYPDYIFGASQPQLYDWMKQYYPELFSKIKERVKEGRWELQGGMWVEPDTNISGGEALIRQILYGKRYYKKEFEQDVENLWLPDVFGYSGALPQILKKSNIKYFMTIKLSWNEINEFPYHTFHWRGVDGSRVLCHMPPLGNYNSSANAHDLKKTQDIFKEKGLSDEALLLYGIGDGGGGPAAHHQERLTRFKNFEGLPPVRQGFANDFFKRIEKNDDVYPEWSGELYLECHRGTYTTHGKNKRFNRKIEILLREAEYVCVLAMKHSGFIYPQENLERIWKEVLLYQFHDILPGSSIARVYDESIERYTVLIDEISSIIDNAYEAMSEKSQTTHMLMNSVSWQRREWVKIENDWHYYDAKPFSFVEVNKDDILSFDMNNTDNDSIENEHFKVIFSENGAIISIYDKKNGREIIENKRLANVLNVYEDNDNAWDIDMHYDEKPPKVFELVSKEKYIDGPKVNIKFNYKYNNSTLIQTVSIMQDSDIIDFKTIIDWHEREKMLRTSFPLNVYSNQAECSIQFGSIKRPTHRNTSWDVARYEVCAHKWVDISDEGYGVALLNDCKYGHKVLGNVIDINLLRSTNHPGENADHGKHCFKYALYPHSGNAHQSNVEKKGYVYNIDPIVLKNRNTSILKDPFIAVDSENIVIETIKKCEDSDDIIIRMYESADKTTSCRLSLPTFCTNVKLTDMMENDINEIIIEGRKIKLLFKPFEILTIKIQS